MDNILSVVERLKGVSGLLLDRSFGQGMDAVKHQLELREGSEVDLHYIEREINIYKDAIKHLDMQVLPYEIPSDYRFFLQYLGGMFIKTPKYHLMVDGIGPMVETWYSYILGDSAITTPSRDGFLTVAEFSYDFQVGGDYPRVIFLIDLVGRVQENAIIGVGPLKYTDPPVLSILESRQDYPHLWKVVSPNFTAWLNHIAETDGSLGYL